MTSTQLVQNEIKRFLSTDAPEVLCISGEWGVGKTFTWQSLLDGAVQDGSIKASRHSYVSLFGTNSLEGLKISIAENSVTLATGESEGNLEKAKKKGRELISKAMPFKDVISKIPSARQYIEALDQYLFSTVQNQIICVDDLERRGSGLSIKDVLGLISFLREQRKCKVVILINDGELKGDGRTDFDNYSEKVIDATLKFEPEPEDSVRIALTENDIANKLIGENCIKLGISNIRVIKKIERFVQMISSLADDFDKSIYRQAVHSLTLFTWSKYQPTAAPSCEFLKTTRSNMYLKVLKKDEGPKEEAAWNALLDTYQFSNMDEFDLALLEGIENGFFDMNLVKGHAENLELVVKQKKKGDSFSDAWNLYHGSFSDNEGEVVTAICESLKQCVETVTPANLSSTVTLFKDLGHEKKASELIEFYIAEREGENEFWDLNAHYHFPGDVKDLDVAAAFETKLSSLEVEFDPVDTLMKIAKQSSWNPEDITGLATVSADDYLQIFKEHSGQDGSAMIWAALKFEQFHGATAEMLEISKRAKEALTKIGMESNINARRVRPYGIDIGESKNETN